MLSELEYYELKSRLENSLEVKIRDRKIKAVRINSSYRWQPPLFVEVDRECASLEKESKPEKIIAIFEHASFLVVTADRGYKAGSLPYFFLRQDVQEVIEY